MAKVTKDSHADATLKDNAMRVGDALADFVGSAYDKTQDAVKTKATEFYKSRAFEPGYMVARKDSADIARLGPPMVTGLATVFEGTITMSANIPIQSRSKS